MEFRPSKYQSAIFDWVRHGTGSAIVEAVAGAGKTTTIVQALNRIPSHQKVLFLAFNKSIAQELQQRVPAHVEARTLNSLGHKALSKSLKERLRTWPKLDSNKTRGLMRMMMERDEIEGFGAEVKQLVGLAKAYGLVPSMAGRHHTALVSDTRDQWEWLVERFDLDLSENQTLQAIDYARQILAAGIQDCRVVDYDDQLYLPVIKNMPLFRFDWVFVDEAQDLSPIQHALVRKALKPGARLAAVGDPSQAIYGFRGADSNSMENLQHEFCATRLPLSISYRCPKSVVRYAQRVVSHIEAADSAPDGSVFSLPAYGAEDFCKQDLVICRYTAPLVSTAYALISQRVGVKMLGREIGTGLVRLIERLKPKGIHGEHGILAKLEAWKTAETEKYLAKGQEEKIDAVNDRYETLVTFIREAGVDTIPKLKNEIEELFNQEGDLLTLATIHKAKGLEAQRVFVLNPDSMPSSMARKDWQLQQEYNLMYVAYTRAQESLIFINQDNFRRQRQQSEAAA